jgi:diguanylate cyclase (GGDEF)-like protein
MYIDIVHDTTSSISISEISDDTVNASIKYSEWRMMIVNMIWPEDQEQFLRRTDPDYLKKNFTPGRTSSFDCMMRNLEGKYIWVKLIFSRAETSNEDDYRFVFMVQNIHENSVELLLTLKKYEKLALTDPLTGIFNHGGIETEIYNAINIRSKTEEPVSLMMLDIDFFKKVNDTMGHEFGNVVIYVLARCLEKISGANVFVARYGGEEFGILTSGIDEAEVFKLIDAIRMEFSQRKYRETSKRNTFSGGIARYESGMEVTDLFREADEMLYVAKDNGKNKIVYSQNVDNFA